MIDLFWASRSGASFLTEAEKRSPFVRSAFEWFARFVYNYDQERLLATVAAAQARR